MRRHPNYIWDQLADAVRMATANAARYGLAPQRAKGLVPGERGDLVVFEFENNQLRVKELT